MNIARECNGAQFASGSPSSTTLEEPVGGLFLTAPAPYIPDHNAIINVATLTSPHRSRNVVYGELVCMEYTFGRYTLNCKRLI